MLTHNRSVHIYWLFILCFLHSSQKSDGFIASNGKIISNTHQSLVLYKPNIRKVSDRHNKLVMFLNKNNKGNDKNNTSKVFKMDYSEDDDYNWIYKPKYAFGMTEYHFTLLKIYVYMVTTIYFIGLMLDSYVKM